MSLTVYGLGTAQNKWTKVGPTNATGDLADPGIWAYVLTLGSIPTGSYLVDLTPSASLDYANCFAMMFYGEGGSTLTAKARFWGISAVPNGGSDNYFGTYLGSVDLTTGAASANSGIFAGTTTYFVNDVSVSDDATNTPPGIRVVGDAGDGPVLILFDSMGFSRIIVQLTCTGDGADMSKVGFLWRAM